MSTLTTTFPGARLESASRAAILDTRRSSGFWRTLGWFALAAAAAMASLLKLAMLYTVWAKFTGLTMDAAIEKAIAEALFICPIVLVLCIAARRAGWSLRTDLGLTWPHWRYILLAFGLFVAEVALNVGLAELIPSVDEPGDAINPYGMGGPFMLVMMFVSIVIINAWIYGEPARCRGGNRAQRAAVHGDARAGDPVTHDLAVRRRLLAWFHVVAQRIDRALHVDACVVERQNLRLDDDRGMRGVLSNQPHPRGAQSYARCLTL